jgi:hypothetical protein
MKASTVLLILGTVATALVPSTNWASSTGTYDYVSRVNIDQDNFLYINVPGNLLNNDNCQGTLGPWYARSEFDVSNDRTRAQMQVALASLLSRLPVSIVTVGCSPDGNGRLLLKQIQLQTER